MSTNELTHQLQRLTLQEARLNTQLLKTKTEIELVRTKLTRATTTPTQQTPSGYRIGTRVEIINPTKITTVQTQQWIDQERRATITGITHNKHSPYEVVRYQLTTDNRTKTWRKAQNVRLLQ